MRVLVYNKSMLNKEVLIDNSIVICPKSESKRLIAFKSKECPSLNVKFIDKSELMNGVYYDFDLEAIDYLSKTHHLSFENAKEVIVNARNTSSLTNKTQVVESIKKELAEKGFLKLNKRFPNLFKGKTIIVYGYSDKDKELARALSLLNVAPAFIKESYEIVERDVTEFENIDDEVIYVIEKIFALIDDGTDPNDIFIYEPASEYIPLLKKYSALFSLPIELGNDQKLIDSPLFKEFISLVGEKDVEEAFDVVRNKYHDDPYDSLGRLTDCINQCSFAIDDINRFKQLLRYLAKATGLREVKYDHSIKLVDDTFKGEDNQHVFVLGFSLGSFPRVSQDTDFYSDAEKEYLFLNDSKTKSEIDEEKLINFLNATKNIQLSRKKKMDNNIYFDSLLVDKLGYKKVKGELPNALHSKKVAEIIVSKSKDLRRLYSIDSSNVETFKDDELGYRSYDHSFKPIESYEMKKTKLSYTSINDYNECPFSYYLKRVLKLNTFESNFAANLGTLFHQILEDSEHIEIDLSNYDSFIQENFKTEEEKFFVEMLLPQSLEVIKKNQSFKTNSKFNKVETEKEIKVQLEDNVTLEGTIDKIMFDEDCKNVLVVDYKTSNFEYKDSDATHGIHMQLPLYAYLLKQEYPEYKVSGLYIQNVLFNKLNEDDKTIPYILNGLTLNDFDVATRIDTSLGTLTDENGEAIDRSLYVKNIALAKKGGLHKGNTKTLMDDYQFAEKIELTERLVQLALKEIKEGKFPIRPLEENENSSPCTFCGCRDICFRKFEDKLDSDDYYAEVEDKLATMIKEETSDEI